MESNSIKILNDNLDILVKRYDLCVKNNNFGESLNVLKNIDMLHSKIIDFAGKVEIKESENVELKSSNSTGWNKVDTNFLDWYNVLKFFIDSKQSQLIELDYSDAKKHRQTGKTYALYKLSSDLNIPIYTNKINNDMNWLRKQFSLNPTFVTKQNLNLKQYKDLEILLVDEWTSYDLEDYIIKNYKVIGFKQYFSGNLSAVGCTFTGKLEK